MQNTKVISRLEKQIRTAKIDLQRIKPMIDLANELRSADTTRSIELATKALALAEKSSDVYWMYMAYSTLAAVYLAGIGDVGQGFVFATKANELSLKLNDPGIVIAARSLLANVFYVQGELNKAIDIELQLIQDSEHFGDEQEVAALSSNVGMKFVRIGEYSKAITYIEKAVKYFKGSDDHIRYSVALNNLGMAHFNLGEYDKALYYYKISASIREDNSQISALAQTLVNIGEVYVIIGEYDTGIDQFMKGYTMMLETRNLRGIGGTLYFIADAYFRKGEWSNAQASAEKALEFMEQIGQFARIAQVKNLLGRIWIEQGEYEKAIQHLKVVLATVRNKKDSIMEQEILFVISCGYSKCRRFADSEEYAKMALDCVQTNNATRLTPLVMLQLAEAQIENGNIEQGHVNGVRGLEVAQEFGQNDVECTALKLLTKIEYKNGNIIKAFEYQTQYIAVRELVVSKQHTIKQSALLLEFEVEQARKESEINKLRSQQLEQELIVKRNELNMLALHLVNKNEFLHELNSELTATSSPNPEFIQQLSQRLRKGIESEKDWQIFEQQFTSINPEFATKLMQKSKNALSKTEIRVCSLLKMGLLSKDIANMLFISVRTVEDHRYKITKKLKLKNVKLTSYLSGL